MKRENNQGRNELIVSLYQSGKSMHDVASIVGLSKVRVRQILVEQGVKSHCRIKITDQQLTDAMRKGYGCTQIAEMFDVTSQYVYTRAIKLNLISPHKRVSPATIRRMYALREKGYTNKQISSNTGFAYQTVLRHLGKQPEEITAISREYGGYKHSLTKEMQKKSAAAIERKRLQELRLELERKKAMEEAARAESEQRIKSILDACGLPSDIHIESSTQGNAILANMQSRLSAVSPLA